AAQHELVSADLPAHRAPLSTDRLASRGWPQIGGWPQIDGRSPRVDVHTSTGSPRADAHRSTGSPRADVHTSTGSRRADAHISTGSARANVQVSRTHQADRTAIAL